MTPQDLNDLLTPEERAAFAALWADDPEGARQQVRAIMDLFARPKSHVPQVRLLVFKLIRGLLSPEPEMGAWMQAVAAGSFELRPEQKYAMPGIEDRAARFIDRGRSTLDEGVSPAQRKIGITDATACDGMNLVLFGSVAKEFRNVALARVAIGTAWPLAAGVDKFLTNEEHRLLYRFGDDDELQTRMAAAARHALRDHLYEKFGDEIPRGERAASHERELPIGVDLRAHFTRADAAVLRYREELMTSLGVGFNASPSDVGDDLARTDAATLKSSMKDQAVTFSYMTEADGSPRHNPGYEPRSIARLRSLMPVLTKPDATDELIVLAARAHLRFFAHGAMKVVFDRELSKEVGEWVRRGWAPPADLRVEHAQLFEEEAALLFVQGKNELLKGWRELGFFPDPCPAPLPDLARLILEWWEGK
jgi:hypothetical protein